MSGRTARRVLTSDEQLTVITNVRRMSGVAAGEGPTDKHLIAAVAGFTSAFDYWYIRVMRNAVPMYRNLVIKRVNPFIRAMECAGWSPEATANRLIEDYNARNFVTAGGWALEEMAVCIGPDIQKSSAEGIDVQRFDPETGDYHLYVLKSGLVTRNSDILNSLKKHARQAEKLLLQGRSTGKVYANYAIVAGKSSSTFEDGIRRPSSAEFWSEMTGLPVPKSIDLALAVAAEAGRLVRRDASEHIAAMKLLVGDYIASREYPDQVDWEFLALLTMQPKEAWAAADRERHKRAMAHLRDSGYTVQRESKPAKKATS